jgi:hypothetical protein
LLSISCVQTNAERLVLASLGKNIVAIFDGDGKTLSRLTAGPKTGHAGHHDIQLLEMATSISRELTRHRDDFR